jgi:predicted PolB exonuclease-like 3'-5' exonuclease
MSTNHLFWHLATYNNGTVAMTPPYHQIIAIAGIDVQDDSATAWFEQSGDTRALVLRLDQEFAKAHHVTSFTGRNFGLPVLVSNALKTNASVSTTLQKVGTDLISHTDLAKELQGLTNPDGYAGFDLLSYLCGLPKRIDLDVAGAWTNPDPKVQARVGKRLLVDVVLIALGYARLQHVSNVWDTKQTSHFTRAVIKAAAQKVPIVAKMFGVDEP